MNTQVSSFACAFQEAFVYCSSDVPIDSSRTYFRASWKHPAVLPAFVVMGTSALIFFRCKCTTFMLNLTHSNIGMSLTLTTGSYGVGRSIALHGLTIPSTEHTTPVGHHWHSPASLWIFHFVLTWRALSLSMSVEQNRSRIGGASLFELRYIGRNTDVAQGRLYRIRPGPMPS